MRGRRRRDEGKIKKKRRKKNHREKTIIIVHMYFVYVYWNIMANDILTNFIYHYYIRLCSTFYNFWLGNIRIKSRSVQYRAPIERALTFVIIFDFVNCFQTTTLLSLHKYIIQDAHKRTHKRVIIVIAQNMPIIHILCLYDGR